MPLILNEARVSVGNEENMSELKRENVDRIAGLCGLHGPHAQVGVNVGTSLAFGEMKIDVSVTLTCYQTEFTMDEAARIALEKSQEYMNLGLVRHGLEPIEFEPAKLWQKGSSKLSAEDRFTALTSGRGPVAHVGVLVGTSLGYGEVKVKSNVRLTCDQMTERLDQAVALAIEKTNEYTSWGLSTYKSRR